jgi:excisionase family DNA binding protein
MIANAVAERLKEKLNEPAPTRYTKPQAAKYLNISERYLEQLTHDKMIARCDSGCRKVLYDIIDLEHYRNTCRKVT